MVMCHMWALEGVGPPSGIDDVAKPRDACVTICGSTKFCWAVYLVAMCSLTCCCAVRHPICCYCMHMHGLMHAICDFAECCGCEGV